MRVSVLGLGYVGCVSAACLARSGHHIVGVDLDASKVDMINRGQSPIVEPGLAELLAQSPRPSSSGSLVATTDAQQAILATDISLICVGTPSRSNGGLNLDHMMSCIQQIGSAIHARKDYHLVVARSTILPGTTQEVLLPALERASGKRAGEDFGLVMNPEFLREGTSINDFYHPPYTVIGEYDDRSGRMACELYAFLDAPLFRVSLGTAEMTKYANNAFHALKVAFANEVGAICHGAGIDSHTVMDIFCEDRKLNLSPCYLKPGFAFGGSCLPKDLRAITHKARELDVEIPLLGSIMESNRLHLGRAVAAILATDARRIGLLGLSFKAGTDDLRESPLVDLVETLIGKGKDLRIFDANVLLSRLIGANKAYIEEQVPHIASLMAGSIEEVLEHSELVVVGNGAPEFAAAARASTVPVYDLVRVEKELDRLGQSYSGICW